MTAVARGRAPTTHYRGRGLLLVALAALTPGLLAMALDMAWPHESNAPKTRFVLGAPSDHRIGSVTQVVKGRFYLVRLSSDEFVALSWRDPHRGCTVPWRPTFVWPDASGLLTSGWFRDPCDGSTYDRAGHRVWGPSPRDMDRLPVSLVGGRLVVDPSHYVCGFAPPDADCVPPAP